MRRKRERESFPWLKIFVSATAVGLLGLVGYQVANEAVNAGKHPMLAPYETDNNTFADFPELTQSLEADELFVPRFLINEVPELFVNTLPEVCASSEEADSFTDLLAATPEHSLSARGSGAKIGRYVFTTYATRTVCRDGQAEFRLTFTRGSTASERVIFTDTESGRQAMLTFLQDRFRTLSQRDLPELVQLQLSSVSLIPVHQLEQLRSTHPEDLVSQELEQIVHSLYTPDFNSRGITSFRVVRSWSRSYGASWSVAPSPVRIELSFSTSDTAFLEGSVFLLRSGERLLLNGTDTPYEIALDSSRYPALYAFLGGDAQ